MKRSASLRKARFGSRREEVVKLLQRGFVTVAELASHTGLTDNAIRSHLLALERDGLLKRKGSRPGSRRPHHLYQLTSRAQKFLARASETALTALLDAIKKRLSVRQLRQLLETGGTALAARVASTRGKKSLQTRVQNAARLLNALGGAAAVENDANGFHIRSHGCPLNSVVAEHPEACLLVENFLAHIIGAKVREHCIRGSQSRCCFAITAAE
jgi:predicted ArsR family transcriptional regulator